MSNAIILPKQTTFYDWACELLFIRPDLEVQLPPKEKEEWRGWAEFFVFTNQQQYPDLPFPDRRIYPTDQDWKEWAALMTYMLI